MGACFCNHQLDPTLFLRWCILSIVWNANPWAEGSLIFGIGVVMYRELNPCGFHEHSQQVDLAWYRWFQNQPLWGEWVNRRVIRGLFVVLLLGLITHCASKTQVRVRYRVVPQRSPERFQPPKQSPSPRGLLLWKIKPLLRHKPEFVCVWNYSIMPNTKLC